MKHGPIEIFWSNKVDSKLAQLVMHYGDGFSWHIFWLIPLCILFFIANALVGGVILVENKIVNRKRGKHHEYDKERAL